MTSAKERRDIGESGLALAIVFVFLLVLTVSGIVAASLTATDVRVVSNLRDEKRSLFLAEAGIHEALRRLSYLGESSVTVDGNTFNQAFAGFDASGNPLAPRDSDLNWHAQILYDGTATAWDSANSRVTTPSVQATTERAAVPYSVASSPTDRILKIGWNLCPTSGTLPTGCSAYGAIRRGTATGNWPILDITSTGISGDAQRTITVSAEAHTGLPSVGVYKTGCTPPSGISMNGTVSVTVNSGIQNNSSCSQAIEGGNNNLVSADGQINVVGDVDGQPTYIPAPFTGAPAIPDPLDRLDPPCFGAMCRDAPRPDAPAPRPAPAPSP